MTKILDFLVENYIYVAAISAFLIISLIGFLMRGNKKSKKSTDESKTPLTENKTNDIEKIQTAKVVEEINKQGFINEVIKPVKEEIPLIENKTNDIEKIQPTVFEQINKQGLIDEVIKPVKEEISLIENKTNDIEKIQPTVFEQINKQGFLNETIKPFENNISDIEKNQPPKVVEEINKQAFLNETFQSVEEKIRLMESKISDMEKNQPTEVVVEINKQGFINEAVKPVKEEISLMENNVSDIEKKQPVEIQNKYHVEPAMKTFQVILDKKPTAEPANEISRNISTHSTKNNFEVFDIDDTIVLNREKLDEEVDIIDFSNLNKYESNGEFPKPQDDNNGI